MRNTPVRILIADDHAFVREGMKSLLEREEGWCVVGEARNGREVMAQFEEQQPDVVLMDVRMPQMNGFDAMKRILVKYPKAAIILLSTFDEQETIYQAIRAGAKAFLLKDVAPEQLLLTVAQVAVGKTCITPHVSMALTERMQVPELTVREQEVLEQLVAGKSNQEIGQALFIAEGTVKVHISNVIKKLGVNDRTKAVTAAMKRGLVHLE